MKALSQRRAFTILMTLLTPAFAIGVMGERYGRQADIISDIFKLGSLISICTAIISFVIWTILSSRRSPFKTHPFLRGILAGFLTALIIIPLPAFGWSLKTELLNLFQSGQPGLLMGIVKSIFASIKWGLWTFVDITKASLIALIGSSAVGAIIAHYIPAKAAETT